MNPESRRAAGILLVIFPTVLFGGVFILSFLISPESGYMRNPLRQDLWRAGHAHAGVLLVLSLVILRYVDEATAVEWGETLCSLGGAFGGNSLAGCVLLVSFVSECDGAERFDLFGLSWSDCSRGGIDHSGSWVDTESKRKSMRNESDIDSFLMFGRAVSSESEVNHG